MRFVPKKTESNPLQGMENQQKKSECDVMQRRQQIAQQFLHDKRSINLFNCSRDFLITGYALSVQQQR